VKAKRARGRGWELVERRIREPLVPDWVDPRRVEEGERFLTREFHGEVFVPDELWDAYRRPAA
jgi:hypothetical protein